MFGCQGTSSFPFRPCCVIIIANKTKDVNLKVLIRKMRFFYFETEPGGENVFTKVGLFVSVNGEKLIQRTIVTRAGTVAVPDTTITEEILRMTEMDLTSYRIFADEIEKLANASVILSKKDGQWDFQIDPVRFAAMRQQLYARIEEYEKQDPFDGGLLHVMADDVLYHWFGEANESFGAVDGLNYSMSQTIGIYMQVMDVLEQLAEGEQPDLTGFASILAEGEFRQILTYDGTLKAKYRFCSHEEYYSFLMMHFMAGHPRVRQCQHCGRYFIPRTNRRTLYCDRVIRDGRTCKELGPVQKHKRAAGNNEVIEAFDRNMRKMRKRCERAMDARDEQSDRAVYNVYCDWLEQARKARDGYLAGEVTKEAALEVICVE